MYYILIFIGTNFCGWHTFPICSCQVTLETFFFCLLKRFQVQLKSTLNKGKPLWLKSQAVHYLDGAPVTNLTAPLPWSLTGMSAKQQQETDTTLGLLGTQKASWSCKKIPSLMLLPTFLHPGNGKYLQTSSLLQLLCLNLSTSTPPSPAPRQDSSSQLEIIANQRLLQKARSGYSH